MKRLRILLVEDDAVIGLLLTELLSDLGHEVCATAVTEIEAVAAAVRYHPDLMIVDAELATGNGVSAMKTILRLSAMPHIFMTGGSRRGMTDEIAVLQKPFGTASLLEALEAAARRVAPPTPASTS